MDLHRRSLSCIGRCLGLVAAAACARHATPPSTPAAPSALQVQIVTDEADAALTILSARREGQAVPPAAWSALFQSEGYRRLQQREAALGRSASDSEFTSFLLVDSMARREPLLRHTLDEWRRADMQAAANRALAYLPAGAKIRARVYLTIKPRSNSFVFEPTTNPAIFLFIDPATTRPKLENTIAHELHHIGYASACTAKTDSSLAPPMRTTLEWMSAFGEGLAMLAAVGGPNVHPHSVSPPDERARWDRDTANVADDFRKLDRFFVDVLTGRLTQADSIQRTAMAFFGVQGPWYTVGWTMARTIELADGRAGLVERICRPDDIVRRYGAAADRVPSLGRLPRWSDSLLTLLGAAELRGRR
jgi:hypothetical protein